MRVDIGALRIDQRGVPPHGEAGQPFNLRFAPRRGEPGQRRVPNNLGVVAIGHDDARFLGLKRFTIQRRAIKGGRDSPEKPIAKIQIVGPFGVAQQIAARDFDLHDHKQPFGINPHQVRAPVVLQRDLRKAPDVVAREKPAYPSGDLFG